MSAVNLKRKLAAILSADVEGYSRLMSEDEVGTIRTVNSYKEVMTSLIRQHSGRVVDAPGDNLLAEFASIVDAVNCAVEIQRELAERNETLPAKQQMHFRMGVNLGDIVEEEEQIYGDGVNIAARLESLCDGGGICISGTAFEHVENKLDLKFIDLGKHKVKNILKPIHVYRLITSAGSRGPAMNLKLELPEKPSIAVLPFVNLSGDPEDEYISDGLTENIISGLSKIPEMFVIASNSSFTYKGRSVKVQQVAEDLGVRYVLEGSIQKFAEQLRVTAQLIDALQGHHLLSEKYDRKLENFFSVQDDITLNIVIALQVKLTEGEQARVRHSTENLEAWALAVKAHGLFETYTRENISKARELFKKVVELDPNYAYAWSLLGYTYWNDGVYNSAHYDREKSFENAFKMAEKALNTDTKSPDAHALLGVINLSRKKYDEAEAFGKKAIDLNPNSSENHAGLAITMQNIGKFEEAIALVKQAMRLDPYYPSWYIARLGMCYQMVGMYEKSAASFEEMIKRFREREGTGPWDRAYLHLASTYSMMGRLEEARDLVSKALEFNPKMTVDLWRKRHQYKDPEHTERILDALRSAGLPE